MSFKDRLKLVIKDSNLTASAFAEKIDIQPSSISHVLSGRNKPSLEFIQKIISNFNNVTYEWLIDGNGVYGNVGNTLFDNIDSNLKDTEVQKTVLSKEKEIQKTEYSKEKEVQKEVNKVVKIVFFHEDGSFKEYSN